MSFDPLRDVFWKTGFEDGTLNAFSERGISPGGLYCTHPDPSGVWINDNLAFVRSGKYSMRSYIHPPPHNNECRRVSNRYYGTNIPDNYYESWWIYFPRESWDNEDPTGWGSNFGGPQIFWGPPEDRYKYWMGARIHCSPTGDRRLYFAVSFDGPTGGDFCGVSYKTYYYSNFYIRKGLMDTWIRFMVRMRFRTDGTGLARAWINDTEIGAKTGLTNDPRAYSQWNTKNCAFAHEANAPWLQSELYQEIGSRSHYTYVDDIVGSLTYVPLDYRVDAPVPVPGPLTIEGHVTDRGGIPILGAVVSCDGYPDVTEVDGYYALASIPPKAYALTVTAPGYRTFSVNIDGSAGGTYILDVVLEELTPIPPIMNIVAPITVGLIGLAVTT